VPPSRGVAKIAGFNVEDEPLEVKRRVGYLPENVPLYSEMRVARFLEYVAGVKGVGRSKRKREVASVIERCGLDTMEWRTIQHLSKGFRQRVGLAQALIGNPPVLILDEPTVGLDPGQIIEIREMIRSLASEHTVLLSTHILPEVTMLCERVLIIHRGRIVAQDSMSSLMRPGGLITFDLEVTGRRSAIVARLESIPQVRSVKAERPARYIVVASGVDGVAEALSEALVSGGFHLRAMQHRKRTLEDVFVEATSDEPAAGETEEEAV
jgi:ABC-2 type transport system ATP-binding protein